MRQKLEDSGFNSDEVDVLEALIETAEHAYEGDAFERAKLKEMTQEQRDRLEELFKEYEFESIADRIGSVSMMRVLIDFRDEVRDQ